MWVRIPPSPPHMNSSNFKIPLSFRHVPYYKIDLDGRISHDKIKGWEKRFLRKRQIKMYLKDFEKE